MAFRVFRFSRRPRERHASDGQHGGTLTEWRGARRAVAQFRTMAPIIGVPEPPAAGSEYTYADVSSFRYFSI